MGLTLNLYIWIALGALIGWGASLVIKHEGRINTIESIVVGVFGSAIGGEFIADQLRGKTTTDFSMGSLGLAVTGAVVMLLLLRVMRGAVGPLKSGKPKARRG